MPGIIVPTMAFGGFVTAIGLSDDLRKGLIDRFRSLPMSRAAVLAGRTLADVAPNLVSLDHHGRRRPPRRLLVRGERARGGRRHRPAAAVRLRVLVGLRLRGTDASSPEFAQAVGFIAIFPLTFASSASSRRDGAGGERGVNPFTTVVNAIRALFLDVPAGNAVWGAVAWSLGLTAVSALLAVRRYRRAVTR